MSSYLGGLGEDAAVKFLTSRGYQIVARNFRTKFGEIDIVAQDGDEMVFVEVKMRGSREFGSPAEAVTNQKLRKLQLAIEEFMVTHGLNNPIRLEVIEVEPGKPIQLVQEVEPVDNQTFSG